MKLPPLIDSSKTSQCQTIKSWGEARVILFGAFCRSHLCGTLKGRVNSPTLVFSVVPVQRNLSEKLPTILSLKITIFRTAECPESP